MRKLVAIICLTIPMLLGTVGMIQSDDFQAGAVAYLNGDYAAALRLWPPMAEQGGAETQFFLGLMYDKGEGVTQDYKMAVKWYTLAAEQGGAKAQNNLGAMYYLGQGVLQDYIYAHMWANIAASNGGENSRKLREIIAEEITPAQIEKAQELARECVRKE